jgi:hypothetical protein
LADTLDASARSEAFGQIMEDVGPQLLKRRRALPKVIEKIGSKSGSDRVGAGNLQRPTLEPLHNRIGWLVAALQIGHDLIGTIR